MFYQAAKIFTANLEFNEENPYICTIMVHIKQSYVNYKQQRIQTKPKNIL